MENIAQVDMEEREECDIDVPLFSEDIAFDYEGKNIKLPDLIESDLEIWTDYLGDYVNMWLRNTPGFFDDQKDKMVRLAFCPFLFGVTDNLPVAWVKLLVNLENLKPEKINEPFSATELDEYEMAEVIFKCCADLTKNKKDLTEILNFIYDIEERSGRGSHIDISYCLEKLVELKLAPILKEMEKQHGLCGRNLSDRPGLTGLWTALFSSLARLSLCFYFTHNMQRQLKRGNSPLLSTSASVVDIVDIDKNSRKPLHVSRKLSRYFLIGLAPTGPATYTNFRRLSLGRSMSKFRVCVCGGSQRDLHRRVPARSKVTAMAETRLILPFYGNRHG
ncbi:hypothetical protein RRG08_015078 [Elysia crispata]|uniref:Uncharacterized protein n=1 Tax=Elysia crispata TaxID=231223 RepID=A0AAE1B7H9_9GAST|nr:hypothetical protein RRG08_015078 [Elysia crispata]